MKKINKIMFLLVGPAFLLLSSVALADSNPAVEAVKNLFNTSKKIVQTDYEFWLNGEGPGSSGFCTLVDENLDSVEILNNVGGRKFKQASAEEQDRFVQAMRSEMANFIAGIFSKFDPLLQVDFKLLNEFQGNSVVEVSVRGDEVYKSKLVMEKQEGTFKLVEVFFEGYQLIKTQKDQLRSAVKNMGLEKVIAKLNEKNQNTRRGMFGLCD